MVMKRTPNPSSIIFHQHQSSAALTDFYSQLSAEPLKCVITIYQYRNHDFQHHHISKRPGQTTHYQKVMVEFLCAILA